MTMKKVTPLTSLKLIFLIFVVLTSQIETILGIKVFKSTVSLSDKNIVTSGARLLAKENVSTTDLTMCIRFNYKTLGFLNRLMTIEDYYYESTVRERERERERKRERERECVCV